MITTAIERSSTYAINFDATANVKNDPPISKDRIQTLWKKLESQKKTPMVIRDSILETLEKLKASKEDDKEVHIAVGLNMETKSQYRFRDILPMLKTIVVVDDKVVLGNFVGEGISPYTFIAAQAPKGPGISAFWHAAFKYSKTIFDLTSITDTMPGGKLGPLDCYPEKSGRFDDIEVTLKSHKSQDIFQIYKYKLKIAHEEKVIKRVRFSGWPDLGVILVETLEKIVDMMLSKIAKGEVLIVHCGAGVGRSGVGIIAAILKEKISSGEITLENLEQKVEEILLKLRDQRGPFFVTTSEQLELVMEYATSINNNNNHTNNGSHS
jgi:protein tyrosine phosphatase